MTTYYSITPAGVRAALDQLSFEVQIDPYGDEAKYLARHLIRWWGDWIRPFVREVIDHSMTAEQAIGEAKAILFAKGEAAEALREYHFGVYDLQVDFVDCAIEQAVERLEYLAQFLTLP